MRQVGGHAQARVPKSSRWSISGCATLLCTSSFVTLALVTFLLAFSARSVEGPESGKTRLEHVGGGFSINTPTKVADAAADSMQVDLLYGGPESIDQATIASLRAHNMSVIDGRIWYYLQYFECHRVSTCSASIEPALTTVSALLAAVSRHLQTIQSLDIVAGYWVLDDWPFSDPAGARDILIAIHRLIQQYTPGLPAICGFGGALLPIGSTRSGWNDLIASNFAPGACDMVGLYLYARSGTLGPYDWSMAALVPAVLDSLRRRGWDLRKEPLIGIPQAFGGNVGGAVWPTPSAADIATQSQAFCAHGATGIVYYAWSNTDTTAQSVFPWSSTDVTLGIRLGMAACKRIWSGKANSA